MSGGASSSKRAKASRRASSDTAPSPIDSTRASSVAGLSPRAVSSRLSDATRDLCANRVVALALDAMRELRSAGEDDAAVHHDVNGIGSDVLQDARVMRDDQKAGLVLRFGAKRLNGAADRAQRIDVEAGVRLVEDGVLRCQDGELQHFEALLFTAGESVVHVTAQERRVHVQQLELVEDELAKFCWGKIVG